MYIFSNSSIWKQLNLIVKDQFVGYESTFQSRYRQQTSTSTIPHTQPNQPPVITLLHGLPRCTPSFTQNATQSLPVPGDSDLDRTLSSMRQIMDEQEYRFQKSQL
jgi:hypothetical protein